MSEIEIKREEEHCQLLLLGSASVSLVNQTVFPSWTHMRTRYVGGATGALPLQKVRLVHETKQVYARIKLDTGKYLQLHKGTHNRIQ